MKRWRREPRERGLAAICQGTRGWDYCESGEVIARVRPLSAGRLNGLNVSGWYWYGDGVNTASTEPFDSPEDAQADVVDHFKEKKHGKKD